MPAVNGQRLALITGASRGIGAACARRLARDGLAVALNSDPDAHRTAAAEDVAEEILREGGLSAVYPADVSDVKAVDAMFGKCEAQLGLVDVLVLNAALTSRATWSDVTDSEWDEISAVNLRGAFLCCRRAFAQGARKIDSGAIVTVSSVLTQVGSADALPYTTTKAGLLGFTRSLSRALGPSGIRVNAVMPGAIQTEQEIEEFSSRADFAEVERNILERQSTQRRGQAVDIANVVSFLVGPDSSFMTGQTLCVDGGWVLL